MSAHQDSSITVRQAGEADIPNLAHHRAALFRDMGKVLPTHEAALTDATAAYLRDAIAGHAYVAWVAEHRDGGDIIGSAGVQLRTMLPRPSLEGDLEFGPEALIVSVYVESGWRRRGVANALMRTILDALGGRGIRRILLHASEEGRLVYERLGFVPTNQMQFDAGR